MKISEHTITCMMSKSLKTFQTYNSSQHVALFFGNKSKKSMNIYSTGYNFTHGKTSVHAEIDATNKLLYNCNGKSTRKQKVNLLVIRFNNKNQLTNSMPCFNCILEIHKRIKCRLPT